VKLCQPQTISAVAGGTLVIPTDTRTLVGNTIGVSVVVTGAPVYEVDWTMDDPYAAGGATHWTADTAFPAGSSTSLQGNLAKGFCTAIRLNVSAGGTGNVTIVAWQSESTAGA
jgi:hypothetical protein